MSEANPYAVPEANVELPDDENQVDLTPVYSPRGRFGRLSYLAWLSVLMVLMYVPMILIGVVANPADPSSAAVFGIAMGVLGILILPVMVIFMVRRLHDIGVTGWLWLLVFVPLINLVISLVLVFSRGTVGANKYGPPRVTRTWERYLGWLGVAFFVLSIIGIIAAIAIPAYQAYLGRAGL